jgi:hypothetical protein
MAGAEAAGSRVGWDPAPEQGWVAPHVAAEFPGLGIAWIEVDGRPGKSPEPVRRLLRDLSDRFFGAHAIHMRERPIPWAYRVFFRQIGLDPDRTVVILNLMQQDAFALRAVMRLGYVTANPITRQKPDYTDTSRFPFGVVLDGS